MKKLITGLQEDRLVYLFAISGLLLIVFPVGLANVAPIMIGLVLVLYAVASFGIRLRYKEAAAVNPGKAFVYLILGLAVLHQKGEAIGAIGGLWAMISLFEAAEEINEAIETKNFSLFHMISIVLSTVLAVMLLFNPFEHFEFHMRILGIEMILSIFQRRHNIIREKRGKIV